MIKKMTKDLDQLKHYPGAVVYKDSELAASITRMPDGALAFRYIGQYLAKQLPQ